MYILIQHLGHKFLSFHCHFHVIVVSFTYHPLSEAPKGSFKVLWIGLMKERKEVTWHRYSSDVSPLKCSIHFELALHAAAAELYIEPSWSVISSSFPAFYSFFCPFLLLSSPKDFQEMCMFANVFVCSFVCRLHFQCGCKTFNKKKKRI